MLTPKIISISQLNFYVKSLLDADSHLNCVFVTGEISNLKDHYSSGHIYLSLKDEKSVISCVMFAGYTRTLKFKPQNGMKIIARGRVTLYEPTGQYQLYIEDMQPDGVGALALAFDQLKNKLQQQGLFEQAHKKPIPKFPHTIGVITSPTGAAVQDIKNILLRRFPSVDIVLYPVLVQGENASAQLVDAINTMSYYNAADVIIIGRGGGSIEDLWAFNSEELAYAIYACNIPVISAVGHETDFTICDFVADLRAPTPSAAAELAVPDCMELKSSLYTQQQYLSSLIDVRIKKYEQAVSQLNARFDKSSPEKYILNCEHYLDVTAKSVNTLMQSKLQLNSERIKSISAKLEALSPLAVLARGYCVTQKDDKTVTSVKQLNSEDVIDVQFKDGKIKAKVLGE